MLVHPSHAGNVGAAARAMRVMGLRSLVLVGPRIAHVQTHPDAIAWASGATDVLAQARTCASLDEALADTHLAVAVSAASREFGTAPLEPGEGCERIVEAVSTDQDLRVALVFGNERTGLSITQLQRCAMVVSIPGEPDYHSLNLAQAVQVLAWELRRAAMAAVPDLRSAPAVEPDAGVPATHAQREAFLEHFEQALIAVGFLDPAVPRKLMPRMRRLFGRAQLRAEEVDLLRGVCKQMLLAARGALPGRRPPER